MKESVTALRVADSLLARSSTGFLPSYKERDSQDWNNRLLSPSNLKVPLLSLSGLSSLSVTSRGEEMEFDRGRSEGRQDAADDDIEVQLEVAVAVQQHLQSLRVAAAEQLGVNAHAGTEGPMHNCHDNEGQTGTTSSAHRTRLSFKLADRAMKKREVSRRAAHLSTASQDQGEVPDAATEGAVGSTLYTKALSFIFSLLQSDSTGTVLLLEGVCKGQDGYSAVAANAVKDFLDSCDIFEKQWILPRSSLSEKESATSAGNSTGNVVLDNHKQGEKGSWQGGKVEGKGEKGIEPPSLSSLLISSISPPRSGMQSKKRRRRYLESRSTREGKEAVLLALKYYTKKSEAVHTIAKRASERILDVTAALKLAIIDAKKADFDVLQYQASIPIMVYIDSNSAESSSSRDAERSLKATAFREEQQIAQSDVSNLTHQLKDWEAALKLSGLALSALWGQAVRAALSSPCLMVEAARIVLSGGLHTPSASVPSPLYLSTEISMGYLQFWIACTLGKQKSMQTLRGGLSMSRTKPVTTTKRELNSPAHSWQCIATHISEIQRSQADQSNTSPAHLTASRIALVMAVHTYILASSSPVVAAPCPSERVQKKVPVCGAWGLLTPLCCSASTWEGKDAPLDGALIGLQLMSLSLASRACKLWVGAEKNAFPVFVSTAASLLTVRKQSTVCAHSDGVAGTDTAATAKLPSSQSMKALGDDLGYEVLAWGALQGKSEEDTERGGYREKGVNDDVKGRTQTVNPFTNGPHASIDVIPLSLYITSQAALSCSPLRCDGGYRCTRSYLHVMMTQLSSSVFLALHLQSPLEDPVTSTAKHDSNGESESVLLQLFFASRVPQDRAAACTVFYLTRTLRRMLVNIVAAVAEKEATAMHTRLRTSCNANLLNLLDMPRMAALASCSSSSMQSNQSSDTFSLTEGVCLCMALRVVADTVPQGESLFRYALPFIQPLSLCLHKSYI